MSNRTTLEINHDYRMDEQWIEAMQHYRASGDPAQLPGSVAFIAMRHHSEPSVAEELELTKRRAEKAESQLSETKKELADVRAARDKAYLWASELQSKLEAAQSRIGKLEEALRTLLVLFPDEKSLTLMLTRTATLLYVEPYDGSVEIQTLQEARALLSPVKEAKNGNAE